MKVNTIQLLTVVLLAPVLMKNVASCDKQCELQNSVNHQIYECKLHSLDIQGACLSEHCVKPTHSGMTREPLMFGDAWLSMYLNSIAIAKVVFGRLSQPLSLLKTTKAIQFSSWIKRADYQELWLQIREDYPLNLSILISGGKEINKDSPSNDE